MSREEDAAILAVADSLDGALEGVAKDAKDRHQHAEDNVGEVRHGRQEVPLVVLLHVLEPDGPDHAEDRVAQAALDRLAGANVDHGLGASVVLANYRLQIIVNECTSKQASQPIAWSVREKGRRSYHSMQQHHRSTRLRESTRASRLRS